MPALGFGGKVQRLKEEKRRKSASISEVYQTIEWTKKDATWVHLLCCLKECAKSGAFQPRVYAPSPTLPVTIRNENPNRSAAHLHGYDSGTMKRIVLKILLMKLYPFCQYR